MVRVRIMLALAACVVLAGCSNADPMPDEDVSEHGSLLIVPAPVSDVNELVRGLVPEWKLVAARDQASDDDGSFDLSTTTSAATVATSAAGQGSTRISVYAGTMVTSGSATRPASQSVHAADPRFALDLQKAIVARLEDTYHVKAVGTADPSLNPIKTGK